MKKLFFLALFFSVSVFSNSESQAALNDEMLFRRCYSILVRSSLSSENPMLAKVISGDISGSAACASMIQGMEPNSSGVVNNKSMSDEESRNILQTLYLLHSSWFENHSFVFTNNNWGTGEFYDYHQMGYGLTYQFLNNLKIAESLKGNKNFFPLRQSEHLNEYLIYQLISDVFLPWKKIVVVDGEDKKLRAIPPAPRGDLIGIKVDSLKRPLQNFYIHTLKDVPPEKSSMDVMSHFGGGILGSSAYLLLNFSSTVGEVMDGGRVMQRRWSKAVFKDLLCRNLPVLDVEDGAPFVKPQSDMPFDRDRRCARCHASMDPLLGVIRDLQAGVNNNSGVDFDEFGGVAEGKIMFSYLRSVTASKKVDRKKFAYAFEPKIGVLRLRDFNGRLVEKNIKSLDDLGSALTSLDDFYLCQTRRYFRFLTGIDVETDPLILKKEVLSARDQKILDDLKSLAMKFKASQSQKALFIDILNSDYFRHPNFSPWEK